MGQKKNINWNRVKLGTKPDSFFAKKYGVSSIAVQVARTKRGIPSFTKTFGGTNVTGVDWDNVKLGTRPDTYFGWKYDVASVTVCYQRRKRGIPPFVCPHCSWARTKA